MSLVPLLLLCIIACAARGQHLDARPDARASLCNVTHRMMAGEVELKDALAGQHLTFVANDYSNNAHWYTFDASTGQATGFHVDLMEKVAALARFTYTIEPITEAEFAGYSWSELLRRSVDKYDASLDWWLQTAERSANGVRSPYAFLDLSMVASQYKVEGTFDWAKMMSFADPFDAGLWILILVATAATSAVYLVVEWEANPHDVRPEATTSEKARHVLYLGYAQFTGAGLFAPKTGWGKALQLSYAFFVLLVVASYTANLATFLIQRSLEGLDSLRDAVDQGVGICVWAGTASDDWIVRAYPSAQVEPISGGAWVGLAEGSCEVSVGARLMFEFAQNDVAVNPECALAQVGTNSEQLYSGGWMVGVDYQDRCSSLVMDVFAYWLLELNDDITDMVTEMMAGAATQVCSSEPDDTDALHANDLSGVFILHAVVCAVCLAGFFGRRHYLQRAAADGGGATTTLDIEKKTKGGEELAAVGAAGLATKADVARMDDKFAAIDERLDRLLAAVQQSRE